MSITQWIESKLRRLGWLSHFNDDDVLNAHNEDSLRTYEQAVARVRTETKARVAANVQLRHTLKEAKRKTNSFEKLEQLINGRER